MPLAAADLRAHQVKKPPRVAVWLGGILLLLAVGAVAGSALQIGNAASQQRKDAIVRTGGDPDRGPPLLKAYGCVNCHTVPGISAPVGAVGPDLAGVGQRAFIAGVLPNSPTNLMNWIVDPRAVDPKTAMPKTGITLDQARDVAAYLYSMP